MQRVDGGRFANFYISFSVNGKPDMDNGAIGLRQEIANHHVCVPRIVNASKCPVESQGLVCRFEHQNVSDSEKPKKPIILCNIAVRRVKLVLNKL
jgi:hypothetical protein